MNRARDTGRLGALVMLAFALACGGDPPLLPEEERPNVLRALIDGQRWTADPMTVFATGSTPDRPGSLSFAGTGTLGVRGLMVVSLARIPGPGTYPLGMSLESGTGGTVTFADGSRTWVTPPTGSAGVITIATISDTRITGSLSFSAIPVAGSQSASITASGGEFDVPRSPGFVPATAQQVGGKVSMNIAGFPILWNAAFAFVSGSPSQRIVLAGGNGTYSINISLDPAEVGSGPLSRSAPLRGISVSQAMSNNTWGNSANDQGTLAVTSVSNGRIVGTFSATLAPTNPAANTAPLVLTNGNFDFPLP